MRGLAAELRCGQSTAVGTAPVALRPAIDNWRTRGEDVDTFVDVVLELIDRLAEIGSGSVEGIHGAGRIAGDLDRDG